MIQKHKRSGRAALAAVAGFACALVIGGATAVRADVLTGYDTGTHGTFFQEPLERGTQLDGETFTVPSNSTATSVDVFVSRQSTATSDLVLSLYDTTLDSLNGPQPHNLLAQVSDPASAVSSLQITSVPFTFTSPVALTGGATYALVLTSADTNGAYAWYGDQTASAPAPYAGGDWIIQGLPGTTWGQQPTSALGFHVNGSVPEPSSLAVVGLIAGGAVGRRARRRD